MKITKNFAISLSVISLSACGLFQAPPSPTPNRIYQNISRVESGTVVPTVALVPMDIPNPTQPKVVNTGAFRVTQDIRDTPSGAVLIPQNALVKGVYSNDGITCQISWQAIYNDYNAMEKNQVTLSIAELTQNTTCNPKLGIRPGQITNITFK